MPGKYGPHGELFFFLLILVINAETPDSACGSDLWTFSPCRHPHTSFFSADVLEKCALIAWHLIAEERRNGEGRHVPGLG